MYYLKRKAKNFILDKKFSEIFTGSVWALGARVISTIFAMVTSIIIARFFGPEMVGIVALINSFLLLVTIFTVMGTGTSILRLIPEHIVKFSYSSAFRLYRKTQFIVIFVSMLTGTLFYLSADIIASKLFSKPHLSFYFAIASTFVAFKSIMLLNTQAVRGLKLIKVFALMQLLPQCLNFILLISLYLVSESRNIPVYALLCSFALTGTIGWIIMELAFKSKIQPKENVHSMPIMEILSISLPMLMASAMGFIIGQTGIIMLGIFRSEAEVGYYSVAFKLASLTSFVLTAINTMAAPKFSELFNSGKLEELFYVAKKSAKFIFWTTSPILFCLVILGKPILFMLFGENFVISYNALVFLVFGQFLNSISGSTNTFMNMTGCQNQFMNIMAVTALINLLSNFVLIPNLGFIGAAISSLISMAFWNIVALAYIKIQNGKSTGYFPLLKL